MERDLRMRESSDGRSEVPPWRVTQRVYGAIDDCPGTVVSVDKPAGTFTVEWLDRSGHDVPVVYPDNTIMVRRAWPWQS